MTAEAATAIPSSEKKQFHWERWLALVVVVVVFGAAANLLGWDIRGWFKHLWDVMSSISIGYLLGAIAFKVAQTSLVAFAYYPILEFAYPGEVRWREIWPATRRQWR